MFKVSMISAEAQNDSKNGKVSVYIGAVAQDISTNFSCKRGDSLQIMLTNGHPCVIGVVGRGDEQQQQIDNAQEIAENLDAGITNDTENGVLTLSPIPINKLNAVSGPGFIEIHKRATYVNNPTREENNKEVANVGWVKQYVEKLLNNK